MIELDFNMDDVFCPKCGSKCYVEMKFDGYMPDGDASYKIFKTCPHSGFLGLNTHANNTFIHYGFVRHED